MGWLFRCRNRKFSSKHVKYMWSCTRDVKGLLHDLPRDPTAQMAWAEHRIRKAGYRFRVRRGVTPNQRRFSVTWRRFVDLVSNWAEKADRHKAVILVHELIHVVQRKSMGHTLFEVRWAASDQWRCALEVPAYAASILTRKAQGWSNKDLRKYIEYKLRSLYSGYKLTNLSRSHYEDVVRDIWLSLI